MGNFQASGTVKSSAGKVVGSGRDQGFNTSRLLAGQEAFAFIFFEPGTNNGSTLKISVSSEAAPTSNTYIADLAVSGANNTGQQLVGIVKNPRNHSIQGPGTVNIYCVSASGQFAGQAISDTPNIPNAGLPAGATSSFSISLYGQTCPTYVVGASGFDQKDLGN